MNAARAGLLALPLFIAMAVYLDGRRYDPANQRLDIAAASGAAGLMPADAAELSMQGRPRTYTKENLFEYVNGHAEFFISLGFQSLAVASYSAPGATTGNPEYVVDIYDMGAPESAFGALTQESGGLEPSNVGFIGYSSSRVTMFIRGKYFLKVNAFSDGAGLDALAMAMDAALPQDDVALPQFALFPAKGAVRNGRSFKRADYMGLDFMHDVFEQEYDRDGARFFAFVFKPAGAETEFAKSAGESLAAMGAEVSQAVYNGASGLYIHDKYEGDWALAFKAGQAFGARGFDNRKALEGFMAEFIKKASGT